MNMEEEMMKWNKKNKNFQSIPQIIFGQLFSVLLIF